MNCSDGLDSVDFWLATGTQSQCSEIEHKPNRTMVTNYIARHRYTKCSQTCTDCAYRAFIMNFLRAPNILGINRLAPPHSMSFSYLAWYWMIKSLPSSHVSSTASWMKWKVCPWHVLKNHHFWEPLANLKKSDVWHPRSGRNMWRPNELKLRRHPRLIRVVLASVVELECGLAKIIEKRPRTEGRWDFFFMCMANPPFFSNFMRHRDIDWNEWQSKPSPKPSSGGLLITLCVCATLYA